MKRQSAAESVTERHRGKERVWGKRERGGEGKKCVRKRVCEGRATAEAALTVGNLSH